jgi:hypothetical protein
MLLSWSLALPSFFPFASAPMRIQSAGTSLGRENIAVQAHHHIHLPAIFKV